jgi:hypothetical protein
VSILGIIKSLGKRARDPISAAITAIRRLKELRTYLRLIAVTVLRTLRACNIADFIGAHRCRAFGRVFKYAFVSELAFASGWLAFTTCVSLYLTTDGSAVLTCSISYSGKTLPQGKSSLDKKPFIVCEVFHGSSFPAGYRINCN